MEPMTLDANIQALMALNPELERHGLTLTPAEAARIAGSHAQSLTRADRMEFAPGALLQMVEAFSDAPDLCRKDFADTLCDLIDLFYQLKNDWEDRIPDDDLIDRMRALFDDPCHGSVPLLADLLGRKGA